MSLAPEAAAKMSGVIAWSSESSDSGGTSGLSEGGQADVDVSNGCCLDTDNIHMGQGLLPWLFSYPWTYASLVQLTLSPAFSSEKGISNPGYY